MSDRQLPWYIQRPYDTDDRRVRYSIVDNNGLPVCECEGDEDGYNEAISICTAMNRAGKRVCSTCGQPATCFGSYEDELHPAYACDECCGHGNEDGHCEPVEGGEPKSTCACGKSHDGPPCCQTCEGHGNIMIEAHGPQELMCTDCGGSGLQEVEKAQVPWCFVHGPFHGPFTGDECPRCKNAGGDP